MCDFVQRWYCGGTNSSGLKIYNTGVDVEGCVINGIYSVPHVTFVVLTILQLLILGSWRRWRGRLKVSPYHRRFPAHCLRWVVWLCLVCLGLALTAEGLLSDGMYREGSHQWPATQPHLYLSGLAMVAGAVAGLVTYDYAEAWRMGCLLCPLLCYSAVSTTFSAFTLYHYSLNMHQGGAVLMRTVIVILSTVFYAFSLLTEIYTIIQQIQVSGCCQEKSRCGDDTSGSLEKGFTKTRMFYREAHSNLLSQLTFWWLNFLFKAGYRRPINYEKLGTITEKHTADAIFARFKMAYEREKTRAESCQQTPSLLRTIARVHWPGVVSAGVLKLLADLLGYVGPFAIGGITLYATRLLSEDEAVNDHSQVSEPHPVTVSEFFSNGYVLVATVFTVSVVQHVCNQTYQHWVAVEGLHAKSAIQSMVYDKTLRLSTCALSGGSTSMGELTNHMSEDANNVMFFFLNVNEIWAIPVKIAVALFLLYHQLGMAAIIAASLFVVVIPIQMVVGTIMARVSKSVLDVSDARLGASNEMLQGIKLLKLYGWEFIHYGTVKAARETELTHLVKLYVLFAITFSINAGTPIVVTLIAFALYTPLNHALLTPDIAFTSLSLFNQTTAPLFLIPYVLHLSVTLLVSARRLDRFLIGPEVQPVDEIKAQGPDGDADAGSLFDDYVDSSSSDNEVGDGGRKRGSSRRRRRTSPLQTVIELECEDENDDVFVEQEETATMENGEYHQLVSSARVQKSQNENCSSNGVHRAPELHSDVAIKIRNGTFSWNPQSGDPDIQDIDITIPSGKLTIIVGPVGSGKSSLLAATLGEMTMVSGTVQVHKDKCRVAYAPQKPWLMNSTLRRNILFGKKIRGPRYEAVKHACSLQPDIAMLPAKDRTEIGERGISLSGGQRQRVSVARAMYSSSDIVLLDDPLSALDMHVGTDLFNRGILGILRQRKQTVVLVTHQLQYLPQADKIIMMENGRVRCQGSPSEIAQANPDLEVEWQKAVRKASESDDDHEAESSTEMERKYLIRQCSRQMSTLSQADSFLEDERGHLIALEDRESGAVAMGNYVYYLRAIGGALCALILISTLLRAGLQIATSFSLSAWSEAGIHDVGEDDGGDEGLETKVYVSWFAGLSVSTVLSQILFNFLANAGMMIAAKTLHFAMLENLIRVPMRFFDVTPVGRILNRLSNDTGLIDQRFLITINMLINSLVNIVASIVVNTVVNPYFILVFAPIAVLFVVILRVYIRTSRELQRIESVSRSPVLVHFSETLGGLTTIRAFNSETSFFRRLMERMNVSNTASLYLLAAQRWLGVRLDLLGSLVLLIAGVGALLGVSYLGMQASAVGLALSYALMVSAHLNSLVRYTADLELQMNAVERIRYYSEVPIEQYKGEIPPPDWPALGHIVLDRVSARYAKELAPVLHDVTLTFQPGQKIGVCGRTGSGKSSLTLALFRLLDTFQGRIIIDGIDIATLSVRALRERLAIIPQDVIMFNGTIRSNLDPGHTRADDELWRALEVAQLKDTVMQLENGLDAEVGEGGDNFSVGQQQLFCLARAFLRKSRVLVMDEATASVDKGTDKTIQTIVEDIFRDRTVLTIAHRIETILNSDFILTLDGGRVAEFDSPENLLRDKDSIFASLVRAKT